MPTTTFQDYYYYGGVNTASGMEVYWGLIMFAGAIAFEDQIQGVVHRLKEEISFRASRSYSCLARNLRKKND